MSEQISLKTNKQKSGKKKMRDIYRETWEKL